MNIEKENYGPKALEVLKNAQSEAQQLGHNFVGTEHLLLGLLGSECSSVQSVLSRFKVDTDLVRKKLYNNFPVGECVAGRLAFTPLLTKIQQTAVNNAEKARSPVLVRHLLLAILKEGGSTACRILNEAGVNYEGAARLLDVAPSGELLKSVAATSSDNVDRSAVHTKEHSILAALFDIDGSTLGDEFERELRELRIIAFEKLRIQWARLLVDAIAFGELPCNHNSAHWVHISDQLELIFGKSRAMEIARQWMTKAAFGTLLQMQWGWIVQQLTGEPPQVVLESVNFHKLLADSIAEQKVTALSTHTAQQSQEPQATPTPPEQSQTA